MRLQALHLFMDCGLAAHAHAQTKTWDGEAGTLNWKDDANWDPDGEPELLDDVLVATQAIPTTLATASPTATSTPPTSSTSSISSPPATSPRPTSPAAATPMIPTTSSPMA